MCELIENDAFVMSPSGVLQINRAYLDLSMGPIELSEIAHCELGCDEEAIGEDDHEIKSCYNPSAHPGAIFPMRREIVYKARKAI